MRNAVVSMGLVAAFLAGCARGEFGDDVVETDGGSAPSTIEDTPFPSPGPDAGTLSLTWSIYRGGLYQKCSDAGATSVELTLGTPTGLTTRRLFECPAGGAVVALPHGWYTVSARLLGPDHNQVDAPPGHNLEIGTRAVTLNSVVFTLR